MSDPDNPDMGRNGCAAFIVLPDNTFIQNGNILPGVMTVKEYLAKKRRDKKAAEKKAPPVKPRRNK